MKTKRERLSLRVLPADKVALERMAQMEGESMAVVIRRLLRRRASELGLLPAQFSVQKESSHIPVARSDSGPEDRSTP